MKTNDAHIPDLDLLRAADGELDAAAHSAVGQHLEACWSCRARMHKLEAAITDYVDAHQSSVEIAPAAGPRAMFKARLAELAASPYHPSLADRVAAFLAAGNRLAYVGGTFLLMAVGLFVWALYQDSRLLPDPKLTPGAALPVSRAEVCTAGTEPHARLVPASVGREVFENYGIGDPRPRAYELDYLIAPELGGADDPRNFWPQPYAAPVWNAHVKDALEDYLHLLVCERRLSLATAQHDISTDWISAYKKYFQTEKPIASHAGFTKDSPWE